MALGLIDAVESEDNLMTAATEKAHGFASKSPAAFASIKGHLRQAVIAEMIRDEDQSIADFIKIWYSESTQRNIREIKIR